MRNNRSLRLDFIEEDEESPRKVYPLTIEEKGAAPNQFNAHAIEEDDFSLLAPDDFEDEYNEEES
jgi:hypothetical protein